MSESKPQASIATHYRRYALGSVLTLAAGFISFPITTRLLSTEQFGILGYWEAWILLLTALLKLGAGDTMMRFYPHGGDERQKVRHATNFVMLPALLGAAVWVVALVVVGVFSTTGVIDTPTAAFAALTIVLLSVVVSHVMWAMGTLELSGLSTIVNVTWRWLGVGATLGFLFFVDQTAMGVFMARIAMTFLVAVWLVRWIFRQMRFELAVVDWAYAKEGMRYGVPLAMKELSGVVLGFIDRIMLRWLLNDFSAVGVYTIGFGLASYVDMLVTAALGQAWTPMANRLYNEHGAAAVRESKRKLLRPLVYVCVGLAVTIAIGGRDFVLLIAGADKLAAAPVFVVASISLLSLPVLSTCGMGLLLERRSGTLFALTLAAAAINVALNYIMIPRFGVMGATVSTCASQITLHIAVYLFCSRPLRCLPASDVLIRALLSAILCLSVVKYSGAMSNSSLGFRIVACGFFVMLFYIVPVVVTDRRIRSIFKLKHPL